MITSLDEFWSLPDTEKNLSHRVHLKLTALYYDPDWKLLWVTDGTKETFFPITDAIPQLRSGQSFEIDAETIPARGLQLSASKLKILPQLPALSPTDARGQFANSAHLDGHLVTVEGYVNEQTEPDPKHLQLDVAIEGYPCTTRILLGENSPVPQLAGALVRATGVYVADNGSTVHPNLWIATPERLEVLGWLDSDPRFNQPIIPIDQLTSSAETVHVVGTVVNFRPGETLVLRDDTGQVAIHTAMTLAVAPGDRLDVIGRPSVAGVTASLAGGLYRKANQTPVAVERNRGLPLLRLTAQVRALDRAAVEQAFSVRLRGAVTWSSRASRQIYLADPSGGLAVTLPPDFGEPPPAGSRMDLVGHTESGGFAPAVQAESVTVRENLILPAGRVTSLEQALTGIEDGQRVSLGGYVRTAEHHAPWQRLTVGTPSGEFIAVLPESTVVAPLVGSVVQFTGVCRAITDAKQQLIGVELLVSSLDDTRIDEPRPDDPFSAPKRTIGGLRQFNLLNAFNHRVRLSGIVVYQEPGERINLQDGAQSIFVLTRDPALVQPGDRVDVVGFPGRQGQRLILRESIFRVVAHEREPAPLPLLNPTGLQPEHDGQMVRIEAVLVGHSHRPRELHLVCQIEGLVFDAIAREQNAVEWPSLAIGSRVALTGLYDLQGNQNGQPRAFALQLRTPRDITILAAPPWWSGPRALTLFAALIAIALASLAWVMSLRRRVERQTAEIRTQIEKSTRLEAELDRSSKLESLGVLAGGIAHDFNNLLTVVLGNLSMVLLGDRPLDPEDQYCLRESERAALRARDLTQQLLTFAKGGDPVRTAVLLPDIIREATEFALHGSAVLSEFDFAADLWPASVDRGQISQSVHNIVINAMQAMPDGGIVRLALRNEVVSSTQALPLPDGRYVHLSIADTGSGIAQDHLTRIFDPYFTTKATGSGLGLATVYSIVKKHGGHIAVESVIGRGTTFRLWLPAADVSPAPVPTAAVTHTTLKGRVLLMDDEATVRRLGTTMLRRMGLDCVATADGRDALREFANAREAKRPFSLVILDLTVPGGMGGKDAATAIRAIDPSVRLVVSSGYSNDPVMAHYREHGFSGCIPKPYVYDQFAAAVAVVSGPPPTTPPPTV